ncbi:MAG: hypothetical protein GKR94_24065 [Gammaproteobacteria bacterium]|nr:hypothetical protein [Gammaproteobacteria bacterium]
MTISRYCRALAGTALMLVAGCAANIMQTKETRFYVLATLPQDTEALPGVRTSPALVLDLAALTLPQYLERPQIVTRIERNRLVLAEFDNWGGSLEKNMLRVLASNLSMLLATPDIHMATRRTPAKVDARVEIEVIQFERGPDRRAVLMAQWRLLEAGRERKTIVSKVTSLQSPPMAAPSMTATVAAMSDLAGELSVLIARAVIRHSNH